MTRENDDAILKAMSTDDSSFVRAFAEVCYRADPKNYAKLRTTFPELFGTTQMELTLEFRSDTVSHKGVLSFFKDMMYSHEENIADELNTHNYNPLIECRIKDAPKWWTLIATAK